MTGLLAQLTRSGHLRRADAALAAWIERAFPAAAPEAALAAALAARAIADGHSTLPLVQAQAWLDGLGIDAEAPVLPDPAAWCDALHDLPDGLPLVLDDSGRVYLRRYHDYERDLAAALVARAKAEHPPPRETAPAIATDGIDPEQQRAIDTALARKLAIVTGSPGTGKTFTVVRMLAALVQQAIADGRELRIALAAPTGKAAARVNETVRQQLESAHLPDAIAGQLRAGTLHRLLGMSPWRAGAVYDKGTPLPFDVVVVDEVSMVDLPLMAKLAAAVADEARLILLGDPGQLAAVEAGDVLGALVAAAKAGYLGDCHVELTHGHRFGSNSALGRLAAAVGDGDADAAFAAFAAKQDVTLAEPADLRTVAARAVEAYGLVAQSGTPATALAAARGFRVLTALRHGSSGCIALDRTIANALAHALGRPPATHWWQGRLLLITANRPELGLYNGDTGVVFPDTDGALKAWFEGPDGTPRAFAPAALPPCEGAFALTVHKAQGSEFERVALVTGPESAVLARELLYTSITRARSGIEIFSTPDVLRAGIGRRTLRMTGLADRLREAAGT